MANADTTIGFMIEIEFLELITLGYSLKEINAQNDSSVDPTLSYKDLRSRILTAFCCCDDYHVRA